MNRYKNSIIKKIAVLLALILFVENSIIIYPVRIFADNYEDSFVEMKLISNTDQNNTILLCKIEDTYYISIQDLCDCVRATYTIENNKCCVSQGMWSVEFDYDRQTFDDSTQKIDTKIYSIADKYWIPAVEFLNYFSGSVLIDEKNNTVKCEMPYITPWEALDIDYENTIFNLYDAYGGKGNAILSFVLAYMTEGLLGNIKGSTGHIKDVYNEALKIDPIEYDVVQSYVSNIEQSNSEYIEESYYDSIPETVKFIDNSEQTAMVVCELLYGIHSSKLMQMCKSASDSGNNLTSYVLSYNYAVDILESYRQKEKIVNAIKTANYATKALSLITGSAITTANEIKLNESSDQLIYKVLGEENYKRLGINNSDNIWVNAANTYKSGFGLFGSNFLTESIGLVTDAMIEGGLDKIAGGSMGAGAVGLIAGRKLVKKCPWTSSGVEGFHSEFFGIMLAQLQKELTSVIKKTYNETDFTNKEDLKQLIDTINMYCRVTIAMYEYLKVAQKEFGRNQDYWQSKLTESCDKAVLSLYLIAPFMDEGAERVIPVRLKKLRRVIEENKDVWLIHKDDADETQTVNELSNEEIEALLNGFLNQKESLYGKNCTFTLTRNSSSENNDISFQDSWEGLSTGMVLGYSIEDFDNDDKSELLLITLADDYRLQLEMYEVVNDEVVLADSKYPDTNSAYGAVQFPCGRNYETGLCGLLSCFIDDTNHKIFIQSSDAVHTLGEGNETFITSMIYDNKSFSDYRISHEIGSSVEDSIPDRVKELSDMGVPNIDYDVYDRIFYVLTPLIECFNGGVHEIVRAEQYTTEVQKESSLTKKIVTETVFATRDGLIEKPVVDMGIESDEIPSVYQIYNEFFAEGYRSAIEYRPAEWALADLDNDRVPEILFTRAGSNREGIFEVFYYNEQTGMVESAGSFTTEYYEVVGCCPEKHLLSIDASKASFRHWEGYFYNNHSIGWSFDLAAMTDPGSNPRTYSLSIIDENGRQDLGKYEMDGCNRIWDDYFGEQNEIEFQYFPTGKTWNLPEGPAMQKRQ